MNVVYIKLRSAKDFRSVPIDGPSISARELKVKIVESSYYGRGRDFDLLMSDAITGGDIDESMMIARGSSVLIRRIPGWQPKPIVLYKKEDDEKVQDIEDVLPPSKPEEPDFHDFGPDVLDCRKDLQRYPESEPISKHDEDERIKMLVNTPSLRGYNCIDYVSTKPVPAKPYWRNHGCLVLEPKIPPPGYVCHRCNEPGHFIKHCPTNGDPAFNIKLRPARGVTAIFKPNEDAFDKEMEGISSMKNVSDLPPELLCSLCKKVMKDSVLSSKCCFNSFCDQCIREHIISKSMCHCGAKDILADDLIPNITLRETVTAMLFDKSTRSTSRTGGSSITVGASKVDGSHHLPSSAVLSTASDNHEGTSSSAEVSSIVKDGERKKNKKTNDTYTKSLNNSDTADGIHGVVIDGEKGNKKRKKMTAPADDGLNSICTSTLNPGMCYPYPFPPATYNNYWSAGAMPLGFDGYLSGGMPYVNYAPYFSGTAIGGMPVQSSYGMQGYNNFFSNRGSFKDKEIHRETRDEPVTKSKNDITKKGRGPSESTKFTPSTMTTRALLQERGGSRRPHHVLLLTPSEQIRRI